MQKLALDLLIPHTSTSSGDSRQLRPAKAPVFYDSCRVNYDLAKDKEKVMFDIYIEKMKEMYGGDRCIT